MNEDKKLRHGVSPKPQDTALDDAAVEAVTGGTRRSNNDLAQGAWDDLNRVLNNQKDKEDQP